MTDWLAVYGTQSAVSGYGTTPVRGRNFIFTDPFNREAITPTGYPTLYTNAETGAGGTSALDATLNRIILTTDANAGDDQDMRTSGLRIDRNYQSVITGMTMSDQQTSSVQLDIPFGLTSAADIEGFIGIHTGVAALTALPTTARHLGIYWDISAGANFMLSASDGTTQTTVDTTTAVSATRFILRIRWTGEDTATLQLYTAAGATSGTGQTVSAFNGASGASHEIHWFVQTETTAGKVLQVYPYRVAWT